MLGGHPVRVLLLLLPQYIDSAHSMRGAHAHMRVCVCARVRTSWKYFCAMVRCSREPIIWPMVAFTTPFRMYSCGVLGSRSLMSM